MESLVAADNALLGDLSYIVNPTNMGNMKGTPKVAGTSSFVAENGQINGYNAIVSTQIDANKYLFGNFSDFLVGLELLILLWILILYLQQEASVW